MTGQLVRLTEKERRSISFYLDGHTLEGLEGDTVLTAILMARRYLRRAEFGPENRAGFCLMGACQDCWVWQETGPRLRACSTALVAGMRLLCDPPNDWHPQ